MPSFTIVLSLKALTRLQATVARTNADTGATLTVVEWIELHLREIAINDDLAASVQGLQQQEEAAARDRLQAAIRAKREELLAAL